MSNMSQFSTKAKKIKTSLMFNGKVSRFLKKRFANTDVGIVGRKGAPFFTFFSKQHNHDSEISRRIARKFDAVDVRFDSDQQNSEFKVPKISRTWSLSDYWGTGGSDSDYFSEDSPTSCSSSSDDCREPDRDNCDVSEISEDCRLCKGDDRDVDESAVSFLTAVTSESRICPDYESTLVYWPGVIRFQLTMVKVITPSDYNAQDRLLPREKLVENHIIPHLDDTSRQALNTIDGLRVSVLDCDFDTEFELTLKKWPSSHSSECYGLTDDWKTDFALRRELKVQDEIGLRWDRSRNRLLFIVAYSYTEDYSLDD